MSYVDTECDSCGKPWDIWLTMACVHEHSPAQGLAVAEPVSGTPTRRCFIEPCDEKPTKLVILETAAMTIKMPMCARHAAEEVKGARP